MPKPYGTNHQVHIRSIVEHVLVLQRLSESPFHASRHSNSRNFSLQRAPGAAEGGGDGVYRDIGDAMAGASIQARRTLRVFVSAAAAAVAVIRQVDGCVRHDHQWIGI